MTEIRRCEVTEKPLLAAEFESLVSDVASGAVVTFAGNVRNHDNGRVVTSLRYEIHPSAPDVLNQIVSGLAAKYDVNAIAVAHRYGEVEMGSTAFLVCVAAAHRASAFEACRQIVEEVKAKLPIWKFQQFDDATHEWVNFA